MSALLLAEVLLLAACAALVLWLLALWVRRRTIASGRPVALCAVRPAGSGRWRLGLLRLGDDLAWFSVSGVTTRPSQRWSRTGMDISTPMDQDVQVPGLMRPVAVTVSGPDGPMADLALERQVYFALRSWLESAPPGHGVNVA